MGDVTKEQRQPSISSARHRTARSLMRTGGGNIPSVIHLYIVERETPRSWQSCVRRISMPERIAGSSFASSALAVRGYWNDAFPGSEYDVNFRFNMAIVFTDEFMDTFRFALSQLK